MLQDESVLLRLGTENPTASRQFVTRTPFDRALEGTASSKLPSDDTAAKMSTWHQSACWSVVIHDFKRERETS